MGILKKAIYKLMRWANTIDSPEVTRADNYPVHKSVIGSNRHGPDMTGMNLTVFNAIGGKVIQVNQYNPTTDRSKQQLYIITDKEDLGVELGQIITVESLGR